MESNLWNQIIFNLPDPHFLQSYEWGQVKAKYGWIPYYAVWTQDGGFTISQAPITNYQPALSKFKGSPISAAALILKRQILSRGFAAKLCILYIPKGPLMDWTNEPLRKRVLADLESYARKQGAIFVKIDPDIIVGRGVPHSETDAPDFAGQAALMEMTRRGWGYSNEQIQFQNTVVVNLSPTEDEMLARMKPKTRYNARLAAKKGVNLRVGNLSDLGMLYKIDRKSTRLNSSHRL